jgi:hypothetical protein
MRIAMISGDSHPRKKRESLSDRSRKPSQHNAGLPIDDLGRRKIDEQLRLVPLFKEHVVSGKPKRKQS